MNSEVTWIEPEKLCFDRKNPRLLEFGLSPKTPEIEIIKVLWEVMGVEEIVLSIKASGFFEHEPLIAVKENNKIVVIEGNRRLAAIRCILSPKIADDLGISKNLLNISDEFKETLKKIPVIVVNKRQDAWKFIGFKHINGPAKWGSYAKAQYISLIKKEYNVSLEDIASQLGDTFGTVQKLYQALQVIEQAENLGKFDRTDIPANRLYFSHLYTGLTYEGFKDFLGLKNVKEETADPVPLEKAENLEELLTWVFGSKKKDIDPVIQSQNPDLRKLDAVIRSPEATYALRDGVSLSQAYDISQPKEKTFEQSLLEAKRALQKAQSYQTEGFDGHSKAVLSLAGSVADIAEELYQAMEKKWKAINEPDQEKKRRISE